MAPTRRTSIHTPVTGSEGSVVIIVMMFILVILALGVALFSMVKFSIGGTELERKEVKAFNVAEAGIDTGMQTLMLQWPTAAGALVAVDYSAFRSQFDSANFPNPTSGAGDFINVAMYDDNNTGNPLAPPAAENRLAFDSNGNRKMWVDSEANVANDRHRILVLAELENWDLTSLPTCAMYASEAGGNSKGLRVRLDANQTTPLPTNVPAYYQTLTDKGVNGGDAGDPLRTVPTPTKDGFDTLVRPELIRTLAELAQSQNHYYDADNSTAWPPIVDGMTYLTDKNNNAFAGRIIYLKSSANLQITGNDDIGSPTNPVVVVLDIPEAELKFTGNPKFFGIFISTGSIEVNGSSSFYGQVLARNTLHTAGSGEGNPIEINYNKDFIDLIKSQPHPINVSIVPNTWEEYTVGQ